MTKKPTTLYGLPVRVFEFDGKFHIEVNEQYEDRPFTWFWQPKAPSVTVDSWKRLQPDGNIQRYYLAGEKRWNDPMMEPFNSLEDAIYKINSLNKGTIIHEL